jgi:hypothetical protein
MVDVNNAHTCGACGFDGGVAHEKALSKLREELALERTQTKASGGAKLTFIGVCFVATICAALCAWSIYTSPPPPVPQITNINQIEHPVTAVYDQLRNVYESCIRSASGDLARADCNRTFETSQKEVIEFLKKTYPDGLPPTQQ